MCLPDATGYTFAESAAGGQDSSSLLGINKINDVTEVPEGDLKLANGELTVRSCT